MVKNRGTLDQIGNVAKTGSFIGDAPLAIAIVKEGADQPHMDAGRALQQMELMAWSEGLGTCFVTLKAVERDSIKKILQIPDKMELITVLPFGIRSRENKGRGTPRKPLSEMVHTESFGKFME